MNTDKPTKFPSRRRNLDPNSYCGPFSHQGWRNSSWLQLFSVVGFYAVIVSIAKGQDILKAFGWFLRLFGIETGL